MTGYTMQGCLGSCLLVNPYVRAAADVPVRCMDEFDVFMDDSSRKKAMEMVLEEAKYEMRCDGCVGPSLLLRRRHSLYLLFAAVRSAASTSS